MNLNGAQSGKERNGKGGNAVRVEFGQLVHEFLHLFIRHEVGHSIIQLGGFDLGNGVCLHDFPINAILEESPDAPPHPVAGDGGAIQPFQIVFQGLGGDADARRILAHLLHQPIQPLTVQLDCAGAHPVFGLFRQPCGHHLLKGCACAVRVMLHPEVDRLRYRRPSVKIAVGLQGFLPLYGGQGGCPGPLLVVLGLFADNVPLRRFLALVVVPLPLLG